MNINIPRLKGFSLRLHIGVLGNDKCGKTSLINTFLTKSFKFDLKENTILNTNRVSLTFDNKPIDLIISEINIQNKQNHQLFKDFIRNIDCFFLCHEIKENDESFNEESIKKYISYINSLRDEKNFYIYIVGCKLDNKLKELKNKTAYIIDNEGKFTLYGQRIKTFVETNQIKKFFITSALLNYNIDELFKDAFITVGLRELKKLKNKEEDMELISNDKKSLESIEIENEFDERCCIF